MMLRFGMCYCNLDPDQLFVDSYGISLLSELRLEAAAGSSTEHRLDSVLFSLLFVHQRQQAHTIV